MKALSVQGGDEALERISDSVGGLFAEASTAPLDGREELGSIVRSPEFHPSSIDARGDDSRELDFIGVGVSCSLLDHAGPYSVCVEDNGANEGNSEGCRRSSGADSWGYVLWQTHPWERRIVNLRRDSRVGREGKRRRKAQLPMGGRQVAYFRGLGATELCQTSARRHLRCGWTRRVARTKSGGRTHRDVCGNKRRKGEGETAGTGATAMTRSSGIGGF